MKLDTGRLDVTLQRGELLSMQSGSPAELSCISGTVWLTAASDTEDHLLSPFESMRLALYGEVIIQALGGTAQVRIRVTRNNGLPIARRLWAWPVATTPR